MPRGCCSHFSRKEAEKGARMEWTLAQKAERGGEAEVVASKGGVGVVAARRVWARRGVEVTGGGVTMGGLGASGGGGATGSRVRGRGSGRAEAATARC